MRVPVGVWQLIDGSLDNNISLSHFGAVAIPAPIAQSIRDRGWVAIRAHEESRSEAGEWPPVDGFLELDLEPFEWDLIRRLVASEIVDVRTNPYYRPEPAEILAIEKLGAFFDVEELIENPPADGFRNAYPPVEFEEPLEPGDTRGLLERAQRGSAGQVPEPAMLDEYPDVSSSFQPPLPPPDADGAGNFLVVRSDFDQTNSRRSRSGEVPPGSR